jgi:superfamily II DNA or RNA helicase
MTTTSPPAETRHRPGSIVRARGREWVVLPNPAPNTLKLRPLGGADQQLATLFLPLEGHDVSSATFPAPDPSQSGSQSSALLLRDALLLKLRAGAGPFRSLGNLALEPRAYQLVPLLMALKQSVTRVLIADEVGLGKTVEALLIARELLDRGEIRTITVICPPHLCEKWRADMAQQFHLAAEVVRPGTIGRLSKDLPVGHSLFEAYPFTVVSLDTIKRDDYSDGFIRGCGDFVIVDEAHTCTSGKGRGRHQRYELLRGLASRGDRHLVLLTATPHSGDSEGFHHLLGLLHPKFEALGTLPDGPEREALREELGSHFVQRRRQDIRAEWGREGADFPDRETREATYELTGEWGALFQDVLEYARALVKRSAGQSRLRQRMSWWAALALLRCISSSPAAAAASLRTKLAGLSREDDTGLSEEQQLSELEALASQGVLDGLDEEMSEEEAAPGGDLAIEADRQQLEDMISRAESLRGPAQDPKLRQLIRQLQALLAEGFRPVIFCRFRPTAHYLAEQLSEALPKRSVLIRAVTGELPPEERVERIAALEAEAFAGEKPRTPLLVATDCLSEGIDLQRSFDAVVHYDLCWNPTRHEQREGRVDRFAQPKPVVRALMLHGACKDPTRRNPVDARVLTVILNKEKLIRKELGVSVPVPGDMNSITQAVLADVLGEAVSDETWQQLGLDLGLAAAGMPPVLPLAGWEATLDQQWQSAKENARQTRTIFAQRRLKPEDVLPEWRKSREALGDQKAVTRLLVEACSRLRLPLPSAENGSWRFDLAEIPPERRALRERLEAQGLEGVVRCATALPCRDGAQLLTRSHPLVVELAEFVAERALSGEEPELAARGAVVRTRAVTRRTTVLLLRLRHQIQQERRSETGYSLMPPLLVEECLTVVRRPGGQDERNGEQLGVLAEAEALALLQAEPAGNVQGPQRQMEMERALASLTEMEAPLRLLAQDRAAQAEEDHRNVRKAAVGSGGALLMRFRCEPSLPVDVIGVFVLLPAPQL